MIIKALKLIYSFTVVALTAFICSEMTQQGITTWYHQIPKTALTPPDFVFPIVWGCMYFLLAGYLFILLNSRKIRCALQAHILFLIQMLLQIVWCRVFFVSGNMALGLVVLIIADFATIALIRATKNLDLETYYLLWPYLFWIMYATLINLSYVYQNGALVMF